LIDEFIETIERDFLKPDHKALLKIVGPQGEILDHFDGRTLNPGHTLEASWFIWQEASLRNKPR